jgi:hypothetical protein
MKCREEGRIVGVACLMATGVNRDGRREIRRGGPCIASSASWRYSA